MPGFALDAPAGAVHESLPCGCQVVGQRNGGSGVTRIIAYVAILPGQTSIGRALAAVTRPSFARIGPTPSD
jgi:hypothetical protein